MNLKLVAISMSFALLAVVACNSGGNDAKESPTRELEKEVLDIHDAVMPRMGEIESLRESLVEELENQALDSIQLGAVRSAIAGLEAGDSLMWDWMHNYSIPEGVEDEAVMRYLKGEKVKISDVRNKMESAIGDATGLLQKLGHGKVQ